MIRVLLVDDQKSIREALKALLELETDIQIVGTADNGLAAIEQVEKLKPDIVIMNIEMPGLNGASATQTITNKFSDTKVLIFTSCDNDEYIAKSLSVGAKGYLLKDTAFQDIPLAIRSIHRGYTQIGDGLLEKLLVQTDSGIILSKLENPTHFEPQKNGLSAFRKIIFNLQSTSHKYEIKLDEFNQSLDEIQLELTEIQNNLANRHKSIRFLGSLPLIFIPLILIFLILFVLYTRMNNLESKLIPIERIGLHGESDLNGLAKRVDEAFKEDSLLSNVSTVYVAQNGSTIILKGTISNSTFLKKMKDIARDIEGVTKVDTSQVIVLSP